ncbi:hypothetical protein [Ruania rhizosphaerae]|uniref:hypothetical protein n=1 Tax=Ruania rhizosphaerae TaxID=1840413 RepID=UPI001359D564|nr:hypothetical protein [Ruania rhizosphaerae]
MTNPSDLAELLGFGAVYRVLRQAVRDVGDPSPDVIRALPATFQRETLGIEGTTPEELSRGLTRLRELVDRAPAEEAARLRMAFNFSLDHGNLAWTRRAEGFARDNHVDAAQTRKKVDSDLLLLLLRTRPGAESSPTPPPTGERSPVDRVEDAEGVTWARLVQHLAIDPLQRATDQPWLWLEDMDYSVRVYPSDVVVGDRAMTRVAVESKSKRYLAGSIRDDGAFWMSIARTESSYQQEFGHVGCLAREIVPLPAGSDDAWRDLVLQHCSARLTVDGLHLDLQPETSEAIPRVVRWVSPSDFTPPTERVPIGIEFSYLMDSARDLFTVTFLSYYCVGNTQIKLTLNAPPTRLQLDTDVFYGRALDAREPTVRQTSDTFSQTVAFATGNRSLLWPGSGVYFRWHAIEDVPK